MAGTETERLAFQRALNAMIPLGGAATLVKPDGSQLPFSVTQLVPALTVLGGTADEEGEPLWNVLLGDAESPRTEDQGSTAIITTREPVERRGDNYWLPLLDTTGDFVEPERWLLLRPTLTDAEQARLEETIT